MPPINNILATALAQNQLAYSDTIQQQFLAYLDLMQTWNRAFNLTAITDPREMVYLHIIDSLSVLPHLHGNRLLDVGTGAGLPGIPLALTDPSKEWVLLDKNSKKTRFLTQVCAELGIKNVTVAHSRTEDFCDSTGFDTILSRAYGTLRMFIETTGHLLHHDGLLLAMKGKHPAEELSDIPNRFTVQNVVRLEIEGMTIDRHLICIKKD